MLKGVRQTSWLSFGEGKNLNSSYLAMFWSQALGSYGSFNNNSNLWKALSSLYFLSSSRKESSTSVRPSSVTFSLIPPFFNWSPVWYKEKPRTLKTVSEVHLVCYSEIPTPSCLFVCLLAILTGVASRRYRLLCWSVFESNALSTRRVSGCSGLPEAVLLCWGR